MSNGKRWTRGELLVALNIYHKLTFGQYHKRNPVIIEVAKKLGRTADSVAMKLSNLASLDPALKLRGIKGLEGASKLDNAIWNEFNANLNEAVPATEEAFRTLFGVDEQTDLEVIPKIGVRVAKGVRSVRPKRPLTQRSGEVRSISATLS